MSQLREQPGASILTVPGLHGSGPSHWQTLWEDARPDTSRVELGMWSTPHRNTWVTKLDRAISTAQAPVILAAHSLGCLAVAWWAALATQTYGWPVAGALLVAPCDVDAMVDQPELSGFAPAPRIGLPFPSIVVASTDDPWCSLDRAHTLAVDWGSHFVVAGAHGHLNADSRLGWWAEGQELLERVIVVAGGRGTEPAAPAAARSILGASTSGGSKRNFSL